MNTSTLKPAEPADDPAHFDAQDDAAMEVAPARSATARAAAPTGRSRVDRLETFISRLAAKSRFVNRLSQLIWLPYAFRSGIRMKRVDQDSFTAVLPFKRFNRNWYNAMAGASLLANSEIAAGMFLFGACGGSYSIVCKELSYKFLRPCFGPAVYRVRPLEDLKALLDTGREFTIQLELDILQQITGKSGKERRVGKSLTTFYVTPRSLRKVGKANQQGQSGR